MIRFIIVCICVIGYLILSIPILLAEWVVGKFNRRAKAVSYTHLFPWANGRTKVKPCHLKFPLHIYPVFLWSETGEKGIASCFL